MQQKSGREKLRKELEILKWPFWIHLARIEFSGTFFLNNRHTETLCSKDLKEQLLKKYVMSRYLTNVCPYQSTAK